jgi:parallel beta-helix repeat protein
MSKKIFSAIMMSLLMLVTAELVFSVQPVKAELGTVYIMADGAIDPPTAPIFTADNVTYTLTGSITTNGSGIVVERDNITLDGAGYTVQSMRSGQGSEFSGVDLAGRSNVTVKNMNIGGLGYGQDTGIYLNDSSNNTLTGNNITDVVCGILLDSFSSHNNVSGNNIGNGNSIDSFYGIILYYSSYNSVNGNNLTHFVQTMQYGGGYGVWLDSSSYNTISGNNITISEVVGIYSSESSNNNIYHNNFINNAQQVYSVDSVNIWDDGYPSGGNYWSDYKGVDLFSGPCQNVTGSDGIGDTPYVIDANNTDHYPLMNLYSPTFSYTAKTVVGRGFSMDMYFAGGNYGDYPETFNVTVYANTTSIASQNVTLTSGKSVIVPLTWNTTGLAYGNYALTVANETNTGNNNLTGSSFTLSIPGDLNGDFKVNLSDLALLANAYGSKPGDSNWNPNADINGDGRVSLSDLVILANHYGQHYL